MELRHQRLHLRHIARLLAAPFSTVARVLNRLGLGRLRNLEPKPPVQRYEREHPGDLIHIDVKKLARFRGLHPDLVPGMGLRDAVPELRGTQSVAASLPVDL